MDRRVVAHRREVTIAVANRERTVAHEAVTERLLGRRAHRLRLDEAIGEVRADELRPRTTGDGLDGGIGVVDPPVGSDRDERVEAGLEKAPSCGARQSDFASDRRRLRRTPLGQRRQLARRDGGDEKNHERDPILRIRNRQRVDGRQEEEVEDTTRQRTPPTRARSPIPSRRRARPADTPARRSCRSTSRGTAHKWR